MIALATELPGLQAGLLTVSLSGKQRLACLGLAALLPLLVEPDRWIRCRRAAAPLVLDPQRALSPARARGTEVLITPGRVSAQMIQTSRAISSNAQIG